MSMARKYTMLIWLSIDRFSLRFCMESITLDADEIMLVICTCREPRY